MTDRCKLLRFGHEREVVVIPQLWCAFEEAEHDDWYGEGACGVARSAALRAEDLIKALPDDLPLPEIAVEPDGKISLDWIESQDRLFSSSVGDSDRMAFAWIDG